MCGQRRVDPAGKGVIALPGRAVAQRGDETEVRPLALPPGHGRSQVEAFGPVRAPDQRDRPHDPALGHVVDQGLDRRKAGAAGDEDDRTRRGAVERDRAEGQFDFQQIACCSPDTRALKAPPGTWRMCSVSASLSCGALAIE